MSRKSPSFAEVEDTGPIYTVYLDAESFLWLEELVSAKLKYHYVPLYLEQVRRVLISFDEAKAAMTPNGEEPRKRHIPRTGGSKR